MYRTFADVSYAHEQLGYQPHVSIEEGVRRYGNGFAPSGLNFRRRSSTGRQGPLWYAHRCSS